ncbi:Uncharacterised protein [Bordetella pertussis]|nr:Uncharacterised protein [Bordetella pertussis]
MAAISFSLPALTYGSADRASTNMADTEPPITSVRACALPR